MRPLAMRMPSASRSDFANRAAQTFSQIISPAVLFGSSARADVLDVLLPEQVPALDAEDAKRRLLLRARLGQLDGGDVAAAVLGDDHEVEDPDRAGVLELLDRRDDLARELVPRERDRDVFDRSDAHVRDSYHCLAVKYALGWATCPPTD